MIYATRSTEEEPFLHIYVYVAYQTALESIPLGPPGKNFEGLPFAVFWDCSINKQWAAGDRRRDATKSRRHTRRRTR